MAPPTLLSAPAITGAANYAVFVITVLGPSFSFHPSAFIDFAINAALVLAAMVIITEVLCILLKLGGLDGVIESLKSFVICASVVVLFAGFVRFSWLKFSQTKVKSSLSAISLLLNVVILLLPFGGFIWLLLSGPGFTLPIAWRELQNDEDWKKRKATSKERLQCVWGVLKFAFNKLWQFLKFLCFGIWNLLKSICFGVWNVTKSICFGVWNVTKSICFGVWNVLKWIWIARKWIIGSSFALGIAFFLFLIARELLHTP